MNGGQDALEKISDVCADEFLLYTTARVQKYKYNSIDRMNIYERFARIFLLITSWININVLKKY